MERFRWTTLSFAHARSDLPGGAVRGGFGHALARLFGREADPLLEEQRRDVARSESERRGSGHGVGRGESDHRGSDHGGDAGHSSGMVARERPHPAPRPSPALARGADSAAFEARWEAERRDAENRSTSLRELLHARDALQGVREHGNNALRAVNDSRLDAQLGDPEGAMRNLTSIARDFFETCDDGRRLAAEARDRVSRRHPDNPEFSPKLSKERSR